MREFTSFTFERYSFDSETLEAKFFFSFDNGVELFEEVIDFWWNGWELSLEFAHVRGQWENVVLNNFLFQLHIALGISYYKLFPTKRLIVKSWYLDDDQKSFWKKFYLNGLGEFLLKNSINPDWLWNFENTGAIPDLETLQILGEYIQSSSHFVSGKNLLLWWWGKDSIVSHSLLEDKSIDHAMFVFGKMDTIKQQTLELTEKESLLVERHLSHNIHKLNEKWYYNGHVPITWIILFSWYVASYLYGFSNIITSNEKSANEWNMIYNWININHQYSKSFEFEKDLKNYMNTYVTKGIHCFSLLRWMYEYKIAKIFSKEKKYFAKFSSCNRNFTIWKSINANKLWCGNCEKCCFVFLLLSNFLHTTELLEIFGSNLFENEDLSIIFRELIWIEWNKPFECVGTYEESLLSFVHIYKKYKFSNDIPVLLKQIAEKWRIDIHMKSVEKLENKLLKLYDEHIIPEKFIHCVAWDES